MVLTSDTDAARESRGPVARRVPRLAVLLLCHESPALVARALASPFFTSPDVKVYLHYDARRSAAERDALAGALPPGLQHAFVAQRVACGWGDYSLVEATHRLLRAATEDAGFQADHLVLLSASCVPIRPLGSLQEFLRRRDGIDFIQAVDIARRSWVKGGLEKERFELHFPFNFKTQRWLFERATALQRRLGIRRRPPEGLRIHFGSQWFCLTRSTAAAVTARLADRSLQAFFAASWIPDEFAIQSLVMSVQRPERVAGHNLTYYEFDDQGRPLVLENGHFDHLLRQPFFFARKLSPHAGRLAEQIHRHVATPELDLSYFARAGSPTSHYARFLARALNVDAARSKVATVPDRWSGVMALNDRPYLVLYGSSRKLVADLAKRARAANATLPAFDFVFDPLHLTPAAEAVTWRGVQSGMRARRDHDPAGFMHELVHLDAHRSTAMGVDPAVASWLRDFVLWDSHATLVCCEPRGLGKLQRAEAALRDISAYEEPSLFEQTLQAAAVPGWLPQDHFDQAQRDHKHRCRFAHIDEVSVDDPDETLRALRAAWSALDGSSYFEASEAAARSRLFGATGP
ncbi:beta-1,6-N-acetylglucosaminyltransferase [Ideonella sp.]|uniref:beta-1,6-N-acetylglucosaminyltransferase n=1 Tax=Ideonella sp. TaxID=1929293 RepID=UPI002B4869DB|nr:beta-1,6-N-acetylglucosaminyltransferase [Ideonella sp.]HJV70916.1 beta-1,6-N-acetylglucosaminyltransferase [Ideonella sp.]